MKNDMIVKVVTAYHVAEILHPYAAKNGKIIAAHTQSRNTDDGVIVSLVCKPTKKNGMSDIETIYYCDEEIRRHFGAIECTTCQITFGLQKGADGKRVELHNETIYGKALTFKKPVEDGVA